MHLNHVIAELKKKKKKESISTNMWQHPLCVRTKIPSCHWVKCLLWTPLGYDLGTGAPGTYPPPPRSSMVPWSQGRDVPCWHGRGILTGGHPLSWFNRLSWGMTYRMWPLVLIANSDLTQSELFCLGLSWASKELPDCRWLASSGHIGPSLTAGQSVSYKAPQSCSWNIAHQEESSGLKSPRKKVLTLTKE